MNKTTALKCDRCPHLVGNVCNVSKQVRGPSDTCNLPDDTNKELHKPYARKR